MELGFSPQGQGKVLKRKSGQVTKKKGMDGETITMFATGNLREVFTEKMGFDLVRGNQIAEEQGGLFF